MMKLCAIIPYLKKIQKMYKSRDAPLSSADNIFPPEIKNFCCIKKCRYLLIFFESLKVVLILMMSAKLVTLHLLKIKVSWNNGYAVTISACHVTNKVLSPDSNYIVDVVMWPTFGSFSVSMREAIITSNIRNLSLRVPVEWFGSGTSVAKRLN